MRTTRLPEGVAVPVLGQGTWHMGERISERALEIKALRLGIERGMTLIDTAEMYAEGGAEAVVAEAIKGQRDKVFLVSKVYPHNATRTGTVQACERSLRRLGTDYIDLYLLHWRGQVPLPETVEAFEQLRQQGKIRHWGVSNFDLDDMLELADDRCAANQVLYNLAFRGIEFDLLPWSIRQPMPVMAYCPLSQGNQMLRHPALLTVAERLEVTPAQVALAWVLRQPGVIAIPKAVKPEHVQQNAGALDIVLGEAEQALLDAAFPPPQSKCPLAVI
ncbi:diketogulonate reductase-like aldo/keto reductase [Pseudomonas duriflava]|uniref:Diketogulonate reductase-like aldo/keto reductase n=1 Tax=Pseudomonas duriflava TaxID=459528 RepID=A0A562QAY4_9PSED|nr:aldo/keto reductase [Pseudomonas duriflava]TWI53340.1 diketogulonate reductase-like aldo/keto reductase [Pseudomonas duriflava]